MDDIEIKLADNGFVVRFNEPKAQAANAKKDAKWVDPRVSRVYETQDALISDLEKLLPRLVTQQKTKTDEYESAFNEAESE